MGTLASDETRIPRACRVFSMCAAGYALLGGLAGFAGWAFDVPRLTDWDNDGICIQPNAALCAALMGAGLLCFTYGLRKCAFVCGGIAGCIGAITLFEIVTSIQFDIHTLLMFGREWGREGVVRPGRMGTPSSTSWTLLGCAMVMLAASDRLRRFVPAIVSVSLLISCLSICGYLYNASVMYSIPRLTAIAFQTATFIAALSAGIMACLTEHQPMRTLLDARAAGRVVRRALPVIVILPFAMGWLALRGERAGFYDYAFGTAMMAVVLVLVLCVLLFWCSSMIRKYEAASRVNAERADVILSSVTDGVMFFDLEGRMLFANREARKMLGGDSAQLEGKLAWEIFPEGRSRGEIRRAISERVVTDFEEFNPVVQRWFAHRVYPSAEAGATIYFQDISERKQSEASLREKDRELNAELIAVRRLHVLSARMMRSSSDQSLLEDILDAAIMLSVADKGMIRLLDNSATRLAIVAQRDFKQGFLDRFADAGPDDGSICGLAIKRRERVVVENLHTTDLITDEEVRKIAIEAEIFATQSTPLFSSKGIVLGVISTHSNKHRKLDDRAIRMLDLLARLTSDYLERRDADQSMRRQVKEA